MFCPECGTWNRTSADTCTRCEAALPELEHAPTEKPNETISALRQATGSRYRVIQRLGGGGMADVFLADHAQLERPVVIKVLHPHLAKDTEMLERFRREAQAAARLVHPHICPVMDAGRQGTTVYTVMPYLTGGSLSDRIVKDKMMDPVAAATAIAQVATALDYAHRLGIVHRDIKPDNVLFDEDGNAILTDFGIAEARNQGRLTASGRAMGTPHYMSPEQAMGRLVDGRSDVYALGVVLYETAVGFPPFDGPDAFSVGYKQVHEQPVPPEQIDSRVPAALSAIIMQCLAKAPTARYARANDLADALIDFLASVPAGADARRSAWVARHAADAPGA
ncbi:MAG TPA: serine/threonine-protein kinase [Gemmatimonadaceae bacterium]|jgi:serine/threonine-protein kinase|nr:serine/threonine-protein kinase [Gemmatimonadaceae bacterium]